MIYDSEPIGALRKGSSVYVRVLKCASTFFNDNLVAQGWEYTHYHKIDWSVDFVFAHVMDPITRRHKGMAEYIDMCGLTESYLDNTSLQRLLKSCWFLDRHSTPYSIVFGPRLYDIFWIPLAADHEKNVTVTQDILNKKCQSSLTLLDWNFDLSHSTAQDHNKKLVELQLQKQWKSAGFHSQKEMDHFWKQFYDAVKDPAWPSAPTAQDFYKLPADIQQEIATLHSSDAIKFIPQGTEWQLHLNPDCVDTNLMSSAHQAMLQADIDLYNHVMKNFSTL